ncbi:MAG: MobA/MobL family protein, partial [Coprococcus sp.]|nr:MobA/MobL family protein [Coprococcus sp.]
ADVVTALTKETIKETEPPSVTVTATVPEAEVVEQPKPQIAPRPVMPPEATAFPRLQKVKATLDKHNHLIFEAERERTKLEIELSDLKGLARLTKKKELKSRIATKNEEIKTLKAGLSGIVRQHGFATVQDFYTAFYTAQRANDAYEKECAKWEEVYGEKATPKAESMHEKLQRYQEKADRQNASQSYRSRDKGAR